MSKVELAPCPLCGADLTWHPRRGEATHGGDECVLSGLVLFEQNFDQWNFRPEAAALRCRLSKIARGAERALAWLTENPTAHPVNTLNVFKGALENAARGDGS